MTLVNVYNVLSNGNLMLVDEREFNTKADAEAYVKKINRKNLPYCLEIVNVVEGE